MTVSERCMAEVSLNRSSARHQGSRNGREEGRRSAAGPAQQGCGSPNLQRTGSSAAVEEASSGWKNFTGSAENRTSVAVDQGSSRSSGRSREARDVLEGQSRRSPGGESSLQESDPSKEGEEEPMGSEVLVAKCEVQIKH